ncbi:MAG: OsmC family protein [Bergeyella sp.]|nr:OsmC family protein [Bergeyella sp.]
MEIFLNRINEGFLFECQNSKGQKIRIDNTSLPEAEGVSPMETILMAVAGCSGIDIISILKKQKQEVKKFSAKVEGERVERGEAKPFKNINVSFFLEGDIDPKKAQRAAQLSFEKYCSVSKTLESSVEITFEVQVNKAVR